MIKSCDDDENKCSIFYYAHCDYGQCEEGEAALYAAHMQSHSFGIGPNESTAPSGFTLNVSE